MSYSLVFTNEAKKDLEYFKDSGREPLLKKVSALLHNISKTPTNGIGKPEKLKHNLTGLWSRRINKEHRIVYEIRKEKVIVYSLKGHY